MAVRGRRGDGPRAARGLCTSRARSIRRGARWWSTGSPASDRLVSPACPSWGSSSTTRSSRGCRKTPMLAMPSSARSPRQPSSGSPWRRHESCTGERERCFLPRVSRWGKARGCVRFGFSAERSSRGAECAPRSEVRALRSRSPCSSSPQGGRTLYVRLAMADVLLARSPCVPSPARRAGSMRIPGV